MGGAVTAEPPLHDRQRTLVNRAFTPRQVGAAEAQVTEICQRLGANHYVSPPGSAVYLSEDHELAARGIRLSYSDFRPIPYQQAYGDFVVAVVMGKPRRPLCTRMSASR